MKLYEKIINRQFIKKKYMFGIFKTIKYPNLKKYYFLGINFAIKEINDYLGNFYFKTPDFKLKNVKKGLKLILNEVPNDCDCIYYISSPTGEMYILANIIASLLKRHKSQKAYFLITKNSCFQIFKLFNPDCNDAKIYCLPKDSEFRSISKTSYKYKGKKIYIYFTRKHYYIQDSKILKDKRNKLHFTDCIYKALGLKGNVEFSSLKLPADTDKKIKEKLIGTKLNFDKFVIFAPEALTSLEYPKEFYTELQNKLNAKGFDVFWNVTKDKWKDKNSLKVPLSYEEILYLATKSKGVIGVRSGLFDVLSAINNVPLFVLYTDFPLRDKKGALHYTSKKALVGFTLKKFPNIREDIVYEYDTNVLKQDEIINQIMDKLNSTEEIL